MFTALIMSTLSIPIGYVAFLAWLVILVSMSLFHLYLFRSKSSKLLVTAAYGLMLGVVAGVYCLADAYTGIRSGLTRMTILTERIRRMTRSLPNNFTRCVQKK